MLSKHIIFFMIMLLAGSGISQKKQQLQQGDIEKVMETLLELDTWIKANKIDMGDDKEDSDAGLSEFLEEMKKNRELDKFFPRNGYTKEVFFTKYITIVNAWMILANQQVSNQAGPDMQQMLESIKNNPHLNEQQKQEMLKSIEQSQKAVQQTMNEAKKNMHPADLEYVKKNMATLKFYWNKLDKQDGESIEMQ